jgi:hypothetical protein
MTSSAELPTAAPTMVPVFAPDEDPVVAVIVTDEIAVTVNVV